MPSGGRRCAEISCLMSFSSEKKEKRGKNRRTRKKREREWDLVADVLAEEPTLCCADIFCVSLSSLYIRSNFLRRVCWCASSSSPCSSIFSLSSPLSLSLSRRPLLSSFVYPSDYDDVAGPFSHLETHPPLIAIIGARCRPADVDKSRLNHQPPLPSLLLLLPAARLVGCYY